MRSPWCLIQAGRREEELGFACGVVIQETLGGEILSLGERHDEAEREDSSGLVRGTGPAAAEGIEGHHVWGSLQTKPTKTNVFGELLLQEQRTAPACRHLLIHPTIYLRRCLESFAGRSLTAHSYDVTIMTELMKTMREAKESFFPRSGERKSDRKSTAFRCS